MQKFVLLIALTIPGCHVAAKPAATAATTAMLSFWEHFVEKWITAGAEVPPTTEVPRVWERRSDGPCSRCASLAGPCVPEPCPHD